MVQEVHSTHFGANVTTAKHVIAWVALGLVVLLVISWYGTYRESQAAWQAVQNKPKPSQTVSATVAPAAKTPANTQQKPAGVNQVSKVAIVSDVTLRKDPSTSSEAIRDLKTGEQLTLVGQVGAWLKVSDASGVVGWVSASTKYTKVLGK